MKIIFAVFVYLILVTIIHWEHLRKGKFIPCNCDPWGGDSNDPLVEGTPGGN